MVDKKMWNNKKKGYHPMESHGIKALVGILTP